MAMSIIHRSTGSALYFGTSLVAWWLIAAATGEAAYETVNWFFGNFFRMHVNFSPYAYYLFFILWWIFLKENFGNENILFSENEETKREMICFHRKSTANLQLFFLFENQRVVHAADVCLEALEQLLILLDRNPCQLRLEQYF